jgi:hypothetical protein
MAGQATRKDYLLAASSGVQTGAEIGFFTVRSPEARLLDRQQQANATLAEFLANQHRMARDLSSIRSTGHDELRTIRDVGSAITGELRGGNNALRSGLGRVDRSVQALDETVYSGFHGLSQDVRESFRSLSMMVADAGDRISSTIGQVGAKTTKALNKTLDRAIDRIERHGEILARGHTAAAMRLRGLVSRCCSPRRRPRLAWADSAHVVKIMGEWLCKLDHGSDPDSEAWAIRKAWCRWMFDRLATGTDALRPMTLLDLAMWLELKTERRQGSGVTALDRASRLD